MKGKARLLVCVDVTNIFGFPQKLMTTWRTREPVTCEQ